ncbi:MAG: 2TM domain-containing protein [Bacteroidetes bacterium]|nr:2TM domain-containing protein [Bacteroidota bacterium]
MHSEQEILKAKKRVKAKKEFYQHLMSYAIVNGFLMALNLIVSPGYFWFIFPLLGWGVGLAFHYVDVFGIPGFDILSKEWEERELEKVLRENKEVKSPKIQLPAPNPEQGKTLELKELRKNYDESDFV